MYLSRTKKEHKEERNRRIFEMWLACYTEEEIGEAVNLTKQAVSLTISECQKSEAAQKLDVLADHREPKGHRAAPGKNCAKVKQCGNARFGRRRTVHDAIRQETEESEAVQKLPSVIVARLQRRRNG